MDIVHYDSYPKSFDLSKYDLICGFGDVFQSYFESKNINAKTIYYGTGMHVCHQNTMTLQRLKDVFKKKNIWLGKSTRFVEKTWSHQTVLVDGIIALGNNVCVESYKKYYEGKVLSLGAPFYEVQNPYSILKNRSTDAKKNFLWFGSIGLIHKGLDLLLDYFSVNHDLTLHICGHIKKDKEFVTTYYKELYETENIVTYDFVDIESIEFQHILESCAFTIYPSCSEGGSPSVLTAVGNGGLIPIIHEYTTISTGNEIWIETLDYSGIKNAVDIAVNLTQEKIDNMANENLKYVLNTHSQSLYKNDLKHKILNIIEAET